MTTEPPHQESRPNNNQQIIQGTAEQLFSNFEVKNTDPDNYKLDIVQNGEQIALHPEAPFTEIIKGPLRQLILQTISDLDFYQPSKIQSQAIPILNDLNDKKSLIAQAPSGSGKTIAFLTSMLLHVNPEVKAPQTLCICNTRELTEQVFDVFLQMNENTSFKGGFCLKDVEPATNDMQLIFGTTQSFITAIQKNTPPLDVSHVNFLVIDEADALFNKKNLPQILRLIKLLPQTVQYGFFSATFPNGVVNEIKKLRSDIVQLTIPRAETFVKTVQHWFTKVDNRDQAFQVMLTLTQRKGIQTYIFCRGKSMVDQIAQHLQKNGIQCEAFSSNLDAAARKQKLKEFRESKFLVIVSTDVLSRGIDVPQTFLVINYGLPQDYDEQQYRPRGGAQQRFQQRNRIIYSEDTYYHRAGRAGRFGRSGLCFTILETVPEERELQRLSGKLHFNLHQIDKAQLLPKQ